MNDIPRGSEKPVGQWLEQIGATPIRYEGEKRKEGPPDFVVTYEGNEIAVEVTLLHDNEGWSRERKEAFHSELRAYIEEVYKEEGVPIWYIKCEYDPREPYPPKKGDPAWRKRVREALTTPGQGGEYQLLSPDKMRGRGVVLRLLRSEGTQPIIAERIEEDDGIIVAPTLSDRICARIKNKTEKRRKGKRANQYKHWWLVFDDEILIAPISNLSEHERDAIEQAVRDCPETHAWDKIVLMSRWQVVPPPATPPKWFYPVWDNLAHPPLPPSP